MGRDPREESFKDSFEIATKGLVPYVWQLQVAIGGKTAAFDVAVFALEACAHARQLRRPRRIALVIDRRVGARHPRAAGADRLGQQGHRSARARPPHRVPRDPWLFAAEPQIHAGLRRGVARSEFVQQVAAQLPWFHLCTLLDKLDGRDARDWYLMKAVEHGWSRNVLVIQIERQARERTGHATTNFEARLPPPQSDLARETLAKNRVIAEYALRDANRRSASPSTSSCTRCPRGSRRAFPPSSRSSASWRNPLRHQRRAHRLGRRRSEDA